MSRLAQTRALSLLHVNISPSCDGASLLYTSHDGEIQHTVSHVGSEGFQI